MTTVTQRAVPIHAAKLAAQGDARALLAIPDARDDISRLLAGKPAKREYDYRLRYRDALATDIGSRKAVNAAKAIVIARQARQAAKAIADAARVGRSGRTLQLGKDRAAARLEAQRKAIAPILSEAFRGNYRVYEHKTRTEIGTPGASVSTTTKWVSGRGGFGHVTDGQTTRLTVPATWVADVYDRDLAEIDGLLTLAATLTETRDGIEVYEAAWIRQGRGYELSTERGWIGRHTASGETFHASTAKGAVSGLKRKLTAQGVPADVKHARAQAASVARATKRAAQLARLVDRMTAWDFAEIKDVTIDRRDSLRAGNCEPGTDQFIERFFPDRESTSATIGELASRIGRLDPATLAGADLTLARQLAAACLVAIRRNKNARRALRV